MKYITITSLLLFLPLLALGQDITYSPLITGGRLDTSNLGAYINSLYLLSISAAALLATIKLIIAGAKYMLSDVVTTQGEAKKEIQSSLLGLLLVVSAVLILTIINPRLVTNELNITRVEATDPNAVAQQAAERNRAAADAAAAAFSGACMSKETKTDPSDPTFEIITQDLTQCRSQIPTLRAECREIPNATFREHTGPKYTCRYKKDVSDEAKKRIPIPGVVLNRTAEEFSIDPSDFSDQANFRNVELPRFIKNCEGVPNFGSARIVPGDDRTVCSLPQVIYYGIDQSLVRLDCREIRGGTYKIVTNSSEFVDGANRNQVGAYCIGCLTGVSEGGCNYQP